MSFTSPKIKSVCLDDKNSLNKMEIKNLYLISENSDLEKELEDIDLLLICLDNNFDMDYLNRIIEKSKKNQILTIAVLKESLFIENRNNLNQLFDSIIIIQKEFENKFDLVEVMKIISNLLIENSEDDITIDFKDFKELFSKKRLSLITIMKGNKIDSVVKNGIESIKLDTINNPKGLLMHFYINPNLSLLEIEKAMNIVYEKMNEDVDIIFTTKVDEKLDLDQVEITLILIGVNK